MMKRKPHHKSRNGCSQCKERRVKCDEARPSCRNCVRRQTKCSLNHKTSSAQDVSDDNWIGSGVEANAQHNTPLHGPRQPFGKATRLKELHLMHHYGTTTCETMGYTPQQVDLWKMVVPKEALKHDFLMDGVLSLAALHCAHLEPSMGWAYTEAAIRYQNSGILGYRAALARISGDSREAIFTFSVILTVLSFAMPKACSERRPVSPGEAIISVFGLLKGVRLTMQGSADAIRTGKFSPLFEKVERRNPNPYIMSGAGLEAAMVRLRQRADFVTKYVGTETRQVYLSSIDSLEEGFQEVRAWESLAYAVSWPVMASHKLIELFKQGDPMALLVWIHYGVLALSLHDQWWGKDFGVRLIEDLSTTLHALDPEWVYWTQWARECASLAS